MARNTNALAELAERLEQIAEVERESAVFHGDPLDASDDIDKARRIVAEIAKVEDVTEVHQLKTVIRPNSWQCYDSIVNCRAIAEEGGRDD